MKNQPTNQDLLNAILANKDVIETNRDEIGGIKTEIGEILIGMQAFSTRMDNKFFTMEDKIDEIQLTMVTKNHLDYRFADLRGEMLYNDKSLNQKTLALTSKLKDKNIFSAKEAQTINEMEPAL